MWVWALRFIDWILGPVYIENDLGGVGKGAVLRRNKTPHPDETFD